MSPSKFSLAWWQMVEGGTAMFSPKGAPYRHIRLGLGLAQNPRESQAAVAARGKAWGKALARQRSKCDEASNFQKLAWSATPGLRTCRFQQQPKAEHRPTPKHNEAKKTWSLQAAMVPGRPSSWATSSLLDSGSVEKTSKH